MVAKPTESRITYYGWVIVFAAFLLNVLCFGGLALVAVLIKPLAQDFGWQRGEVAAAYAIAAIAIAAAGVAFGRVSDRYGARTISVLGAIATGACLLMVSRISSLWQLYVLYAVFGALGPGAIYIPLTAAITNWFELNRGIAVGMAMAGAAVGMGTVPFIASAIIEDTGWRDALVYLGIAYLIVAVPLSLLVRNPSKAVAAGANPAGATLEDEPAPIRPGEALLWVCTAIVFCCICMSVAQVHVPALVSDLGLSMERAASVLTVIMICGALGRLAFGRVVDRLGPLNSYILASFGQTTFVFWFTQASSLSSLYLVAIGYGLFFGGVSMSALLTIRSFVPWRIAGTAIGLVSLFGWIGMGLGGYLGGVFFDWSGSYVASFALAAAAGVVNLAILACLFMRLRRAGRPRLDLEPAQAA
jgi:MFS family permease